MSNNPIKMNKLRMIMRLREQGEGLKQISRKSMTSRRTVKKYLKRREELSMSYADFCLQSDSELFSLFMSSSSLQKDESEKSSRRETLEQLLPEYVKRLSKKGITRHQVHRESLQLHGKVAGSPQIFNWRTHLPADTHLPTAASFLSPIPNKKESAPKSEEERFRKAWC
jgi:hypothetical protein